MPVHDLGYRSWDGTRMSKLLRPWVVAQSGIALVWRRRWLRMMIILSWLPIVVPTAGIFAFEFGATSEDARRMIIPMLRGPLQRPDLAEAVQQDHAGARHEIWSTLILAFFRIPQLFSMVLLLGIIAPMLISYDLRSKAYLLYFSRPLSPSEYIIGKSAVIWFFLTMIVTVPAMLLYGVAILLSPDLSVIWGTWDLPLRILAASVVLLVPTTALALCYSSLTAENRYATFAWFATWVMGFVAYQILTFAPIAGGNGPPPRPGRRGPPNWEELGIDLDKWRLVSPYHTLVKVEGWVFGLDSGNSSIIPAMVVLLVITGFCLWMIHRRIVARLTV